VVELRRRAVAGGHGRQECKADKATTGMPRETQTGAEVIPTLSPGTG
jgi:hypothetical protein